jgi:hypothetical protein
MKHRTADLQGALLDAAVAKAESKLFRIDDWRWGDFAPSTKWEHGGPLIEREKIGTWWEHDQWCASYEIDTAGGTEDAWGPTPLIAAMRCYVASKLGEEVELP